MTKKTIIYLTIIILTIGLAVYFLLQTNNSLPEIQNTNLITKLCNQGAAQYFLAEGMFTSTVNQCGDLYAVYPPEGVLDAGIVLVDEAEEVQATCGGGPLPDDYIAPTECATPCQEKNLCQDIIIDCSAFEFHNTPQDKMNGKNKDWYNWAQDNCYYQNFLRTEDPQFCNNIKNPELSCE